jgi:hypothetical protein
MAQGIAIQTGQSNNDPMVKASTPTQPVAEPLSPVVMTIVTDPEEVARAKLQQERMRRNADWLEANAAAVYRHRGKHFCIAGEELFVGDTAEQAWAMGEAAHPEDDGMLVRYVPEKSLPCIYAN